LSAPGSLGPTMSSTISGYGSRFALQRFQREITPLKVDSDRAGTRVSLALSFHLLLLEQATSGST